MRCLSSLQQPLQLAKCTRMGKTKLGHGTMFGGGDAHQGRACSFPCTYQHRVLNTMPVAVANVCTMKRHAVLKLGHAAHVHTPAFIITIIITITTLSAIELQGRAPLNAALDHT